MPAAVAVLFIVATLVYGVVALSSDATASRPGAARARPAIAIVSSPKIQTLETKIVAKLDAKTHTRKPRLVLGTAKFTIKLTNTGPEKLVGVTVTDPLSPGCNRKIGTLPPGASIGYFCAATNVGRNYTNKVTASGRSPEDGRALVQARTTASVRVKPKPRTRRRAHVPSLAFTG